MNNPVEPIEAMDHVKKRKHSSRRRIPKRSLIGPLIDDAKRSTLEKLPFNCLQHILTFVTYDKVAQLRRVIHEGHKELEGRLGREIERAERRKAHFSVNVRSSNDKLRFLKGLFHAINDCTITYCNFKDYFVAGKLLDEANILLNDFKGTSAVPYFVESAREQKPHPLLGPIIAHSEKAVFHFHNKILPNWSHWARSGLRDMRYNQIDAELKILQEQNERKKMGTDLLENLMQKIDCGNEMGEQLFILISKLNERVKDLIQRAKKLDEVLDDNHSNCLYQSSSLLSLGETKMIGIRDQKRPNLATLPSSCLRNIVSHLNCEKIAQLRAVCKSFNEGCKKGLNEEFKKINQILHFRKAYIQKDDMYRIYRFKGNDLETNFVKDVSCLLHLCEDNYKGHLGSGYYFAAGRVLDEAKRIYMFLFVPDDLLFDDDEVFNLYFDYEFKPHWSIFPLMDMAYKSIAHFKFAIVPKYFPSTQKLTHVPDDVITGKILSFEEESQKKLEEIESLVEETEVKIKELNERNRKFQKIVFGLKKKVFVLKEEISERFERIKMKNLIL